MCILSYIKFVFLTWFRIYIIHLLLFIFNFELFFEGYTTSKEDNAYFIDYLGRKNSLRIYICK